MSSKIVQPSRRLTRARARGQSLPLIGLMVVVLVAMVGLSVDVGNTFQTERRAVAAGNAASLAAMNTYLRRTSSTTNQAVFTSIINTLRSNGVEVTAPGADPAPGELQLEAYYLDAQGRPIQHAAALIGNDTNTVPNNVAYIQVNLNGRVDTFFARVVGRNDLPLGATSWAGTCPNGEGIYPIAISNAILDGNKFRNPGDRDLDGQPDDGWRVLTSGKYAGFTAMRMDVQENPGSGNFSWLRWGDKKGATGAGANSARELEASLTLPGNLTALFEEAPWPNRDVPPGYPDKPGQLNVGDWVWGSTGYVSSMDRVMDFHVSNGTRMVLPIYDSALGNGSNAQYQVVDLGVFVVLSHGKEKQGNTKYIELVFLGRNVNQNTACSYSAAPDPSQTYDLFGNVQIRPQYAYSPTERRPIQYVVVLDVSGSMSANFSGRCNRTSLNDPLPARGWWQCTNGPAGAPAVERTNTGPGYWWEPVDERRFTVAKRALESLVRSTNMPGNAGYDNTRPDDQMALVWYNHQVSRTGNGNFRGFSNNPSTIITGINNAGAYGGDPYRSSGGTNGAAGLYRAALALDAAPTTVTINGKTWQYKRVVVFITDGVSNQFLSKSANDLRAGSSTNNTYPAGHRCNTTPNVIEVASCQVTGDGVTGGGKTTGAGGVPAGMDRPITQAGLVSKEDLQSKGIEVYAIALSSIPDTGLKDTIASFPSYYFSAADLEVSGGKTNVDRIMEVINTQVEAGLCTARTDAMDGKPEWRGDIPPSHFQPVAGLTYPNVGEVIITNVENDTVYRVPIVADSSGKLTYTKTSLPKGNYKLQPYLFYRHPLDPPTAGPRMYSTILRADQRLPEIVVTVGPRGGSAGLVERIQEDLQLELTGDVCKK